MEIYNAVQSFVIADDILLGSFLQLRLVDHV